MPSCPFCDEPLELIEDDYACENCGQRFALDGAGFLVGPLAELDEDEWDAFQISLHPAGRAVEDVLRSL